MKLINLLKYRSRYAIYFNFLFPLPVVMCLFLSCSCKPQSRTTTFSGTSFTISNQLNVFIFLNTECPICQKYQGSFKRMHFGSSNVYYVFPGQQSKLLIEEFIQYDSLAIDHVLLDPDYSLTQALKAEVTPQTVITDAFRIRYRGKIDDRFIELGSGKPIAAVNYIENALISLLNNDSIEVAYTNPVGCFIEPR